MTTFEVLPAEVPQPRALQLAIAAYLARYRASSRAHAGLDWRGYLGWCADRDVDPLAASRPQVELYVRWMQEVRRLKPSTVLPADLDRGRVLPPARPARAADLRSHEPDHRPPRRRTRSPRP